MNILNNRNLAAATSSKSHLATSTQAATALQPREPRYWPTTRKESAILFNLTELEKWVWCWTQCLRLTPAYSAYCLAQELSALPELKQIETPMIAHLYSDFGNLINRDSITDIFNIVNKVTDLFYVKGIHCDGAHAKYKITSSRKLGNHNLVAFQKALFVYHEMELSGASAGQLAFDLAMNAIKQHNVNPLWHFFKFGLSEKPALTEHQVAQKAAQLRENANRIVKPTPKYILFNEEMRTLNNLRKKALNHYMKQIVTGTIKI